MITTTCTIKCFEIVNDSTPTHIVVESHTLYDDMVRLRIGDGKDYYVVRGAELIAAVTNALNSKVL